MSSQKSTPNLLEQDVPIPKIHNHRAIANHSPGQQGMFFGMGAQLGYDPHELKEKAKKKFNVVCFNDLTVSNMIYLIDRLVTQKEDREYQKRKEQMKTDALTKSV